MNELSHYLIKNKLTLSLFIDILLFIGLGYIAYNIIWRLYTGDYTYRSLSTIHKETMFEDIINLNKREKLSSLKQLSEKYAFISRIIDNTKKNFLLFDEERPLVIYSFIFMRYVLTTAIVLFSSLQNGGLYMKGIIIACIIFSGLGIYVKIKQNSHKRIFENYSYKLFKFINNQRSAGIPTQRIITKLHLVVEDVKLQKRLISFAAEYIANNKYQEAFNNNIIKYYASEDAKALDNSLRHGLNVGDKFATTDESEQLMFDKFIAYVDYETERRKMRSILVALLFATTLILIVSYPLILDMQHSLKNIFSTH